MKKLLDSDALELSSVVANSTMNRERVCIDKNSYVRELSFDPLDFLKSRLETQGQAAWLDLCCGRGRALIEAAERLAPYSSNSNLKIFGVDLAPMFDSYSPRLSFIRLQESSVSSWRPDCLFDLITGADDTAGPNYTGQAAVNSHYEWFEV